MPWSHEPIFHDRDCVSSDAGGSTNSSVFEDIDGVKITTVDLASPAKYQIGFNIQLSVSSSNTTISVRATIDGVPGPSRDILIKTNGLEQTHIFNSCPEIEGAKVIQLQWATDKGTVSWQNFSIPYDGIPSSRVLT